MATSFFPLATSFQTDPLCRTVLTRSFKCSTLPRGFGVDVDDGPEDGG